MKKLLFFSMVFLVAATFGLSAQQGEAIVATLYVDTVYQDFTVNSKQSIRILDEDIDVDTVYRESHEKRRWTVAPSRDIIYVDTINLYEKIRFGVKLGGSISKIDEAHSGSMKARFPGLTVGIGLQIPLQKKEFSKLFFTPEVLYTSRGEKADVNKVETDFYNDYISVPLMFKLYLLESRLLFVELGPEVSFLTSQKNKDKDTYLGDINKMDIGLNLGGGVNFGAKDQLELGARLNYGLSKVYPDYDWDKRNYNIGGEVTLTYFFGGKDD
ncbi:MAG: PorT family protein [Tannerella sp.]|jgi:hypothetical protein|nr:PorT family protein [Tannerella sp.]